MISADFNELVLAMSAVVGIAIVINALMNKGVREYLSGPGRRRDDM
jgi:hypothetical protein